MKSKKFWFLTRESIKNKVNTKAFKIINVFLCLIIVALFNLDSIIKFFGGDFDELVNIYVVDEAGIYNDFEQTMDESALSILDNYNAKVSLADKSLDELKENIIKDETGDIIIHVTNVEEKSLESIFNAEIISFDYIDNVLYQQIATSLNNCKRNIALGMANLDQELLDKIDKGIEVTRTLLDEDLNENDELMELVGSILILVFILPIFMLIMTVIQMIGAEINEEKSSKGMEIIISSVSPETHFLSKLVSSNLFAIIQAILIGIYGFIGLGIKIFTTGSSFDFVDTVGTVAQADSSGEFSISEITQFITESNILVKIKDGIPVFIILILLTFAAYTLFIGILASITTSMEDFNQLQTPVMIFLMAGYMLAIFASVFQGSVFIKVMSFIPFVSGILAPVIYILGEITLLDLIIDIFILCGTIFVFYKYGLKIYKVGILNYSSTNLWKKIFKALKN